MRKNIILIATGSVAVIKTKKIYDLLKKEFNVKVLTTPYIKKNYKLNINVEKEENDLNSFPVHIKYAKWANLIIVAPASANTLAKFVYGIADNQMLSTLLASRTLILFAPAMNTYMYEAIKKRRIIDEIANLGHAFIGPNVGMLQEKEIGIGRMSEPNEIFEVAKNYFNKKEKKILIVNGASKIEIDPIRYITNNASGLLGKILANELKLHGHKVNIINVSKYDNKKLLKLIKTIHFDIYISVAAISDFEIQKKNHKIKKQNKITLKLTKSIDVISHISKLNKKIIVFKHDNHKENAIKKLKETNGEFIIWNKINSTNNNFMTGSIIFKDLNKKEINFNKISKYELAKMIVKII